MAITCPYCRAKVSRVADHCGECGGKLVPGQPWYMMALGFLLVLLIFLWAVDFDQVYRLFEHWFGGATQP